jgi:hypothetical protein
MSFTHIAVAMLIATFTATASWSLEPPPTASASHLSIDSPIGALLDNPAAHAILEKYLPAVANGDARARPLTLKDLQRTVPGLISPEVLAKIDAELSALPAAK